MNDLTVIMLTANKLPHGWVEYHRAVLTEAIGDTPLITISTVPLDWGTNLIQTEYGVTNLFRQILRGAEMAETEYVAIAEDDTLYPADHFAYRPPQGQFGYNLNRWQILTWAREPFYFHKPRAANGMMIAHRQMVVDALRARLEGREELVGQIAKELGAGAPWQDDRWTFYSPSPVVSLVHPMAVDNLSQRRRKVPWPVQAYDIPVWRKAKWIVGRFA